MTIVDQNSRPLPSPTDEIRPALPAPPALITIRQGVVELQCERGTFRIPVDHKPGYLLWHPWQVKLAVKELGHIAAPEKVSLAIPESAMLASVEEFLLSYLRWNHAPDGHLYTIDEQGKLTLLELPPIKSTNAGWRFIFSDMFRKRPPLELTIGPGRQVTAACGGRQLPHPLSLSPTPDLRIGDISNIIAILQTAKDAWHLPHRTPVTLKVVDGQLTDLERQAIQLVAQRLWLIGEPPPSPDPARAAELGLVDESEPDATLWIFAAAPVVLAVSLLFDIPRLFSVYVCLMVFLGMILGDLLVWYRRRQRLPGQMARFRVLSHSAPLSPPHRGRPSLPNQES